MNGPSLFLREQLLNKTYSEFYSKMKKSPELKIEFSMIRLLTLNEKSE